MPVFARDLLAESDLRVSEVTSRESWPEVPISWVSTTELADPVPFLGGGELVLTTALRERSEEQWDVLVEGLVAVPVAAVCVGIGLVHERVPAGLYLAAERHGLALVSSPVEVPFIRISRWVADRIFAEKYDQVRVMTQLQDDVVAGLLAGRGLDHLVGLLARQLGAEVAVVGDDGVVLAQCPAGAGWSLGELAAAERVPDAAASGALTVPVRADGELVGYLAARSVQGGVELLTAVANLVGLEVARRQAVLSGDRERVGQVLSDVLVHGVSDPDVARRLARVGVDSTEQHRVVVARAGQACALLARRPLDVLALLSGQSDTHPVGCVEGDVVAVVPQSGEARAVAEQLCAYFRGGRESPHVGLSGSYPGQQGLRIGYYEALQALHGGSGVQESSRRLSLSGLLLSGSELPLGELAEGLLAPLRRCDSDRGSALEVTLRRYLDHDGSVTDTCRAMNLHRNSLRYRLDQIEQLVGKRLSSMQDRLELWLAVRILDPP